MHACRCALTAVWLLAAASADAQALPTPRAAGIEDALQGRSHKDDGLVDDARNPARRAAKAVRKTERRAERSVRKDYRPPADPAPRLPRR